MFIIFCNVRGSDERISFYYIDRSILPENTPFTSEDNDDLIFMVVCANSR